MEDVLPFIPAASIKILSVVRMLVPTRKGAKILNLLP